MKITVVGTGYVGLVSGACLSEFGFDVTCVDANAEKIKLLKSGISPIYEANLEPLIHNNADAGRLHFTTDLKGAVANAGAVIIAVGTPTLDNSAAIDLSQVFGAIDDVAPHLAPEAVVITKSTVMIGTNARIRQRIAELRPDLEFSVVSNPEFLREGSAVDDFMNPDRIVVGVHDENGAAVAEQIYRPLKMQNTQLRMTSLEDAEISKYASNVFLAMKVAFINEIANLCEVTGGNVMEIADIMGMDPRIGDQFLRAGPGFGGSCFPKDTRALAQFGDAVGAPQSIVASTIEANERRKNDIAERVSKILLQAGGKTAAIFGVAFKADTDDIRESPALNVIERLISDGVTVRGFDPKAAKVAKNLYPKTDWFDDPYEAAKGADAIVIMTEWNVLRALDLQRLLEAVRTPTMIDLRNIHRRKEPSRYGFTYVSVGRSVAEPLSSITSLPEKAASSA